MELIGQPLGLSLAPKAVSSSRGELANMDRKRSQEEHPIIALWCHPRSMSTATERIMRERGDLTCHHEPFMYHYYLERRKRELVHLDVDPTRPKSFDEIRNDILASARKGPVFFKDMAYHVLPRLLSDDEFLARTQHVFLIRDPRRSLVSFYKIDPAFNHEEFGLNAELELVMALEAAGMEPIVVQAEDIQRSPHRAMRALWAKLNLPDCPDAFQWSNSDKDKPADWEHIEGWHHDVLESTSIRAPSGADDELEVKKRLETVLEGAPHLRSVLSAHERAYQALKKRVLTVE